MRIRNSKQNTGMPPFTVEALRSVSAPNFDEVHKAAEAIEKLSPEARFLLMSLSYHAAFKVLRKLAK